MIVTDLDGTLLRKDKSISAYTVSVLEDCRSKGIKVVFATARPERNTVDFSRIIAPDAIISNNGAKVSVIAKANTNIARRIDFSRYNCHVYYCPDTKWYMVMAKEAKKINSIRRLTGHFGISLAEVAAFGDDHNDIEMLRQCGIGVAVGNAIGEAKSAANRTCDTNENDGVAKWSGYSSSINFLRSCLSCFNCPRSRVHAEFPQGLKDELTYDGIMEKAKEEYEYIPPGKYN